MIRLVAECGLQGGDRDQGADVSATCIPSSAPPAPYVDTMPRVALLFTAAAAVVAAPSKRGLSAAHSPAHAATFCADLAAAQTAGTLSWTYSWALSPPDESCGALRAVPFEPMIWGAKDARNASGLWLSPQTTHLLAFNEPNGKDQSNLTPAEAAALWPAVVAVARAHNLSLVAPVPSGTDTAWLDAFLAACDGSVADVDVVALHPYSCTAAALKNALAAWGKFGKPLWVTEFNCGDGAKNATAAEHLVWMKTALPILDADARIERYAWMSARNDKVPGAALFDGAGGAMTALGRVYFSAGASRLG